MIESAALKTKTDQIESYNLETESKKRKKKFITNMGLTRSLNIPTEIIKRNEASSASPTATDANGCVVCSSDPVCPKCEDGEDCLLTIQTCQQCPKTYCKAVGGRSHSSGPSAQTVGGLAGGITGGLLLLIGIGSYIFYKYYVKKKLAFNRVNHKEFYFDDDVEVNFRHNHPGNDGQQPPNQGSSRNSLATTMFTRASNIIPIAYIPGVTIGPNTDSGNSRASQYSETNTIDSELIGDRFSKASIIGNPSLTTTAIRAKPKLVNIHDANHGNKNLPDANRDAVPSTAVSASQLGGVKSIKVSDKKKYNPGLQTEVLEEESDNESVMPVDSKNVDYEPFIIEEEEEGEDEDTSAENMTTERKSTRRDSNDSAGSVILEVEVDGNPMSPFDDKFTVDDGK